MPTSLPFRDAFDGGILHPRIRPTILAADEEMTKESTRWQAV